ncbi:hypothetical protein PS718_02644 [Pseudomonas fluorescens]|uniref:Uncharacterized protein n=1 Tax=Pseudomonas fluorescens TaxID=294 RepID=A0A5E7C7S4_PSEFL|nr:hypothetical protein PS718_02644 [Pseudomonas fluorescens]
MGKKLNLLRSLLEYVKLPFYPFLLKLPRMLLMPKKKCRKPCDEGAKSDFYCRVQYIQRCHTISGLSQEA